MGTCYNFMTFTTFSVLWLHLVVNMQSIFSIPDFFFQAYSQVLLFKNGDQDIIEIKPVSDSSTQEKKTMKSI